METGIVNYSIETWISALTGATIVGLLGALPLFIVPNEQRKNDKPCLEIFLSVAVGSQLADVFLHLLPEAFAHPEASMLFIGLWTIFGLFVFYFIEKIFSDEYLEKKNEKRKIKTIGYLNLLANFIDNMTHGATIGGSFAINPFFGLTTLIGIIIHEIPHEMGDFAILLQSGFDRWQATKAQILTGLGGVVGASFALVYSHSIHSALWVLPFTSGAFLYVSLVKTVPDLLKENNFIHTFRQLIGISSGMLIIYFIVFYVE